MIVLRQRSVTVFENIGQRWYQLETTVRIEQNHALALLKMYSNTFDKKSSENVDRKQYEVEKDWWY